MGTPRSHGRQRGPKQHASASSSSNVSTATGPAALERPHRPSLRTERPGRGRRLPSRLPVRLPAGAPTAGVPDADRELLTFNVRLAKNRQALLDTNRIERKAFRCPRRGAQAGAVPEPLHRRGPWLRNVRQTAAMPRESQFMDGRFICES